MKIKVSEATPLQLDYLVAKCDGRTIRHDPMGFGPGVKEGGYWIWEDHGVRHPKTCSQLIGRAYSPSTKWEQGGPIIEREECWPTRYYGAALGRGKVYQASAYDGSHAYAQGPTPLIAACRCYVTSKLGGEVEIPDELCS